MPPVSQSQQPNVAQPPSVHTAVRLMWVGAAINVLSLIVGLVMLGSLKSQIRDQLAASGQQVSDSAVNAAYGIGIGTIIVVGLIGALLWLWMAWKNGQGRPWARIVATVFAALNLISTISSVAGNNTTTVSWVIQLVSLIVGIVVVILLWRKESSEFFNAHRRPVA
jgi:hypothetical protein